MIRFTFVLLFTFLGACSSSKDSTPANCQGTSAACLPRFVKNSHPGLGKAVVMGDSLAAGYGANEPRNTPAGCLREAFGQTTVDNSKPGRTSIEVLMSSQGSFDEKPKVIFISSGGNDVMIDMNQPGAYPAANTIKEMSELFDRALATGAVVVYLGVFPPVKEAARLTDVAGIALKKGVVIVDGMRDFWGNAEFMSDEIHPNDKGYEILCRRTLEAMKGYYP